MKLRVARHTNNLEIVTAFYTRMLGLSVLGTFENHDGYDGVFLGLPGADWHLEFTVSDEAPVHQPDEDDILVFYADSPEKYQQMINEFEKAGIAKIKAKNPYWDQNGTTYTDPEGYRLVIA